MSKSPFPVEPELTQIALAYRNLAYVADRVLPRSPVAKEEFKWLLHTKREGYTIPDSTVGRKGRVNEVEFSATEQDGSTKDYGLEFVVPQKDIDNAKAPNLNINPVADAVTMTTDLIMLGREKRVADIIFAAATYPAGNKVTLSGMSQWSDMDDSDPVNAILTALDIPLIRPNKMVLGQAVATKLRQHPKVVSAVNGSGGNASVGGVVSLAGLAAVLELEEIIVGQSFVQTANPGQTAAYSRLWGKHAALIYQNPNARPNMGVTFGMTATFGGKVAGTWEDRNIGLRGGTRGRVGESVGEIIMCSDCAYFFENAVA